MIGGGRLEFQFKRRRGSVGDIVKNAKIRDEMAEEGRFDNYAPNFKLVNDTPLPITSPLLPSLIPLLNLTKNFTISLPL